MHSIYNPSEGFILFYFIAIKTVWNVKFPCQNDASKLNPIELIKNWTNLLHYFFLVQQYYYYNKSVRADFEFPFFIQSYTPKTYQHKKWKIYSYRIIYIKILS